MPLSHRHRHLTARHFTLVEIMVVVLIIGMILGLVGVGAINQMNKAKVKNTRNKLLIVKQSISMFQLDMGNVPTSLNDLVTDTGSKKWKGPYYESKSVPKDEWGNPIVYSAPGSNGDLYEIYSYGADNAPGGEGFNADVYPTEDEE